MSPPLIRAATPADLASVHALNEHAVPNVSSVPRAFFTPWLTEAGWFAVAEDGTDVLGFLLVLGPGAPYESPNYRWFEGHYDDHWYVDRIVVAEDARSRGLGHGFYEDLVPRARAAGVRRITCEVNVRPPNPRSLAFHLREGFTEAGRLEIHGGSKEVALLVREI